MLNINTSARNNKNYLCKKKNEVFGTIFNDLHSITIFCYSGTKSFDADLALLSHYFIIVMPYFL